MAQFLREGPTKDAEAVPISPMQYLHYLILEQELPLTHPDAYQKIDTKEPRIWTEYQLIPPDQYTEDMFQYTLRVLKVLYFRGLEPCDYTELVSLIRCAKMASTRNPRESRSHYACIPTLDLKAVDDDYTLEQVYEMYQVHFAACVHTQTYSQTFEFVLSSFTGSIVDSWNIILRDHSSVRPRLKFPITPEIARDSFPMARAKFEELIGSDTYATACFFMLVSMHTPEVYEYVSDMIREVYGQEASKKMRLHLM